MARNNNAIIAIIIVIAVAGVLYWYSTQKNSVTGIGITLCYKDGSCEDFKPDFFGLSTLQVSVGGKELDYILASVLVEPVYEGTATSWQVTGYLNAKINYEVTAKQTWDISTTAGLPSSGQTAKVYEVKVYPSTVEGWVSKDGTHRLVFCSKVDVALYNAQGQQAKLTGQGNCSTEINLDVSGVAGATLRLIAVYVTVNAVTYDKATWEYGYY